MNGISGAQSTRRLALPILGAMIFSALQGAPATASAGVSHEASTADVAVSTPEPGTSGWTASSNTHLRQGTLAGGIKVGQVRPRTSRGRKAIRMISRSSSSTVAGAGSTIRVSAALSTSQLGGNVAFRVIEVNQGQVVGHQTTYLRPSTTSWRQVAVTYRTKQAGSRIRVYTRVERVSRRHFLRIKTIEATATPPPITPTPSATTPTPNGACEDINYADPAQGSLTFADEFNGTSIDRAAWRVRDNTFLNHDQAYIRKENVTVHDGSLDIVGKRMPTSEWKVNPQALYERNKTRDYSTGYIDSIDGAGYGNAAGNRFGQKYGYFEVRAWVPSTSTMSRGIWPAFWLRGDHQSGEIDAMESYGAPTIRSYDPSPSYEWNSWADTSKVSSMDHAQGTAHPNHDNVPIWMGWHTYGVNWSPTCLRYTYDGQTVGVVPSSAKPYLTGSTFDDTFHIRINMQIGTNYWGWADPEHTKPEFHYLVDYVRVYQGQGR